MEPIIDYYRTGNNIQRSEYLDLESFVDEIMFFEVRAFLKMDGPYVYSIILKMADRCLRPVPPRKPRHPYIDKLETIFKNPNSSQLAKSLYLLRYITSN